METIYFQMKSRFLANNWSPQLYYGSNWSTSNFYLQNESTSNNYKLTDVSDQALLFKFY